MIRLEDVEDSYNVLGLELLHDLYLEEESLLDVIIGFNCSKR